MYCTKRHNKKLHKKQKKKKKLCKTKSKKIVEELEKRIPSINIDSKQAFKCSNAKLFIFIAQTM